VAAPLEVVLSAEAEQASVELSTSPSPSVSILAEAWLEATVASTVPLEAHVASLSSRVAIQRLHLVVKTTALVAAASRTRRPKKRAIESRVSPFAASENPAGCPT
jgi:hypothetical protein